MKRPLGRFATAGLATLAAATTLMVSGGTSAHAATTPPYEPTASSNGTISFLDASGAAVTSGSTTAKPFATYAVASATQRAGDTAATVEMCLPVAGQDPDTWSCDELNGYTKYPVATAGAPTAVTGATTPVSTLSSTDQTIAQVAAEFPQTGTGAYAGLYQLRLRTANPASTTGANTPSPTYATADISVDTAANTFTEVYPTGGTGGGTTPGAPGYYVPDAARLGDTRGSGVTRGGTTVNGAFTGQVQVVAKSDTPTDADAAVLEVTALAPRTSGFLRVAAGGTIPATTQMPFTQAISQTVLVHTQIASNRSIGIAMFGTSGLVVDQLGYEDQHGATSGATYSAINPIRAVDTRSGTGTPAGAKVGRFSVQLPSAVPSGSTAVLAVTAIHPTASSYLQMGPAGGAETTAVNFVRNQSQSGLAYVPTSASGGIDITPAAKTDVAVDVVGYLAKPAAGSTTGAYVPVAATRIADSRGGTPLPAGKKTGDVTITIPAGDVPAGATSAVLDVSVISPSASSYVTLKATGGSSASTILNVTRGQSLTAIALTKTSPSGQITLHLAGFTSDLVVDLVGYYN